MDGIQEFITRSDEFTVMIGLAIDGESRLGVVYQPTTVRLYYAAHDAGASLETDNEVRTLHVSHESDPRRMCSVTETNTSSVRSLISGPRQEAGRRRHRDRGVLGPVRCQ